METLLEQSLTGRCRGEAGPVTGYLAIYNDITRGINNLSSVQVTPLLATAMTARQINKTIIHRDKEKHFIALL